MFILLFSGIVLLYYHYVGYVTELTYEIVEARLAAHVHAQTLSNLRGQLQARTLRRARPTRLPPLLQLRHPVHRSS